MNTCSLFRHFYRNVNFLAKVEKIANIRKYNKKSVQFRQMIN